MGIDIDLIGGQVDIRASDDPVKIDLELRCDHCDELICDIEAGDTLPALIRSAHAHLRDCPRAAL